MSGVRLPTIPSRDVAPHNSEKSCYVTVGANVFDITSFLPDHPGGGDLILKYGGRDVSEIMLDESSHTHSENAYEILQENLIGFIADEATIQAAVRHDRPEDIVPMLPDKTGLELMKLNATDPTAIHIEKKPTFAATGLSGVEDLTKDTDLNADFKAHRFLDLNKPLLAQVWTGGFSKEFYLEQVHRPRYYSRGESAPLFGNFLDPLTKTAWYVPLITWLPPIVYGMISASQGLSSTIKMAGYFIFGLGFWSLIEYGLHRVVFHMDKYLPDNRVGITMHFLLHGLHHYLPMDQYRIVMPPTIATILASFLYKLVHLMFYWDWFAAVAVFCGVCFGYICYEVTHYFLHMKPLPIYYKSLKKYHLQHHYADYENGFGVTTPFWDKVFGTALGPPRPQKLRR